MSVKLCNPNNYEKKTGRAELSRAKSTTASVFYNSGLKDTSTERIIEIFSNFRKNNRHTVLRPEMFKLMKLLGVSVTIKLNQEKVKPPYYTSSTLWKDQPAKYCRSG